MIQHSSKRSRSTRFSSSPARVRASPCELVELLRIAGDEEGGVAVFEAELGADRLGAFLADVLGDRTGAFQLVAFLAPEDVAEPGWPSPCAQAFMRSQKALEPPVLAGMAQTSTFGRRRGCWRRP